MAGTSPACTVELRSWDNLGHKLRDARLSGYIGYMCMCRVRQRERLIDLYKVVLEIP